MCTHVYTSEHTTQKSLNTVRESALALPDPDVGAVALAATRVSLSVLALCLTV
jgi:hypothetical protein